MKIEDRVQQAVSRLAEERQKDKTLIELRAFYVRMQEAGLVVKKQYDLPPIDTIGRTLYSDH